MSNYLPLDPLLSLQEGIFLDPQASTTNGSTPSTGSTVVGQADNNRPSATASTSTETTATDALEGAASANGMAGSGSQDLEAFYSDWINPNPGTSSSSTFNAAGLSLANGGTGSSSTGIAFEGDGSAFLANLLAKQDQAGSTSGATQQRAITESDAEALARILAQATANGTAPDAVLANLAQNQELSQPSPGKKTKTSSDAPPTNNRRAAQVGAAARALRSNERADMPPPPPPSSTATNSRRQRGGSQTRSAPGATSNGNAGPVSPSPRDESVPEAALHLLRLALPTGPNGAHTQPHGAGQAQESGEQSAPEQSENQGVFVADYAPERVAAAQAEAGSAETPANGNSKGKGKAKTLKGKASTPTPQDGEAEIDVNDDWKSLGRRTSSRVKKMVITDTKALFDSDSAEHASDSSGSDMEADVFDARDAVDEDEDMLDEDDDEEEEEKTVRGKKKRGRRSNSTAPSSLTGSTSTALTASTSSSVANGASLEATGSNGKGKGKAAAPRGRKRMSTTPAPGYATTPAPKKARTSTPSSVTSDTTGGGGSSSAPRRPRRQAAPVTVGNRTFPADVDIEATTFPRFYRRFPVSSAFPPESYVHRFTPAALGLQGVQLTTAEPPGAKWNKSSDPFNLYAPRFVRGLGDEKSGMCPICVEDVARGGEGTEKWLKLKNSSFVYHMSYAHGLSNLSGLPFSPPKQIRSRNVVAPTKDARDHMTEGLCHKCDRWIPLLSVKNVDAVVPELIWWKHAKPCHGNTTIAGEGDYFVDDPVYRYAVAAKSGVSVASGGAAYSPAQASGSTSTSLNLGGPLGIVTTPSPVGGGLGPYGYGNGQVSPAPSTSTSFSGSSGYP